MDWALKAELAESELTNVPGLVEHLFPDSIFPISFATLHNAVYTQKWSTKLNDWKASFFVRTYSGTPRGRVVPGKADTDFATFLDDLGDTVRNTVRELLPTATMPQKRTWATKSESPLEGGGGSKRKPDLCLVPDAENGKDVSASWHTTLVPFELKSHANDHKKALSQLINSAYMIFSTQDERRFTIGISLCAADVRVYVFDRAGVVGSTKFDFSYDPKLLVRLFAGLALCDVSGIGLDPTIRHDKQGLRYLSIAGLEYQIVKTLFISDSIRGRGTVCWQARRDGDDYVIKDTWTDVSRIQTEAEILKAADGIDGVAHLVAEEVVRVSGKDDTTADIRSIIGGLEKYSLKSWYKKVEVRLHRRLVTTPLAEPLTNFRTRRELFQVMIDAIQAHRRLVERHILHRDISINNILIQHVPSTTTSLSAQSENSETSSTAKLVQNHSAKGILIDLDHASITQDHNGKKIETFSGYRTGTLPFMAIGILLGLEPGQQHQPHHDLESFFYILLWIALHYAGPNNVERQDIDVDKKNPVRSWLEGETIRELASMKESSMMLPNKSFNWLVGELFTKYFKVLIPCINELRGRIFNREENSNIPPITHQEMIDILQKHHDLLPEVEVWSTTDDEEGYTGSKRKRELTSIQEEEEQVTIGVEAPNHHGRKRVRTSVTSLMKEFAQSPTSQAATARMANRARQKKYAASCLGLRLRLEP